VRTVATLLIATAVALGLSALVFADDLASTLNHYTTTLSMVQRQEPSALPTPAILPQLPIINQFVFTPTQHCTCSWLTGEVLNNTTAPVYGVRVDGTAYDDGGRPIINNWSYVSFWELTPGMKAPFVLYSGNINLYWTHRVLTTSYSLASDVAFYHGFDASELVATNTNGAVSISGRIANNTPYSWKQIQMSSAMYDDQGRAFWIIRGSFSGFRSGTLFPGQIDSFTMNLGSYYPIGVVPSYTIGFEGYR